MDVLWLILTKADEGLEIQASVGKSLALHFVSVRQTSRQTLFQFTLFGASRQTLFQFGAQRRAGHRDGLLRHRNSVTESMKTHSPENFHCVGDCHCAELENFRKCTTCNHNFVSSHILTWCLGSYTRSALLRSLPTAKVSAVRCVHFTSLTSRKQWGLSGQRDSKALANQTSLGSGPMFGTVRWTYSPNITFSDVLFRVSSLKIPFWWSRNRLRKKKY